MDHYLAPAPGDDRQTIYALRREVDALRSEVNALRVENAALYEEMGTLRRTSEDAFIDELTGLHNRRWLRRHWNSMLDPGRHVSAVMQIDIDHFKPINDRYGHDVGDRMIIHMGSRLRENCVDTVRTGGDEFVLLISREDDPIMVANRILTAAREEVATHRGRVSTTISIGISLLSNGYGPISLSDAMGQADEAMYRAKRQSGNQIVIA